MSASRYFHTVRFLRPVQIFGRLRFRLLRPRPDLSHAPAVRALRLERWRATHLRFPSLLGPDRFRFLNVEGALAGAAGWNDPAQQKLWLYNLHYFDDLNSAGAEARSAWHHALIERWVNENPAASGNGWEPYPLSMRIVNWIKWSLAGNALSRKALHSLAVQARYLSGRLEYHLLGNHLLANAKALVFAGIFFEGPEADEWLRKGLHLVRRELDEQVLRDGGHFELSPMYHNIILEDVLDLINLAGTCPDAFAEGLETRCRGWASSMLGWARSVAHPDGEIALFNDAALGIAAPLAQLEAYAAQLGIEAVRPSSALTHLEDTGYVRVALGPAWSLLDVGRIGPDYLPGHAHADTLSFELSVFGRRVIVDSGTSVYQPGAERLRQRSTAAHNTVEIDGESSSEVWGSFRVARRAQPFGLGLDRSDDMIRVRCGHDGYRRLSGHPAHHREWIFEKTGVAINDVVDGAYGKATARFHFHPDCTVTQADDRSGTVQLTEGREIRWRVETGQARVVASTYHPEFGLSLCSKRLEVDLTGRGASTRFEWAA